MTIQQHLNNVDYSFNGFTPSEESLKLLSFISLINGGKEENKSPLVHCMMIDKMINNSRRTAIMAARGLSKSSLVEYLVLYLACFNELGSIKDPKFIMYVADSIENGVKRFRSSLELKYANSDYLQKLIPNKTIKFLATDAKSNKEFELSDNDINDLANAGRSITDVKLTFINLKGQPLVVRNYGIKTGIRGTRELGTRPTICFGDDVLKEEDARSDTILQSIENIMYQAIPYALHPTKQKIVWVGTPFNASDPLYKAIESGIWDSLVVPICEKFPCEREEFKGAWEDRFTYDVVKGFYDDATAKGDTKGFYQELMMSIISDDDTLIKKEDIVWLEGENEHSSAHNYYITTDLAVSQNATSDYSVISVFAYTANEDFILVDGFCGKILVDEFIKKLFLFVSKYKPSQVGIEVTGQQKGFVEWINNEQYRNNIYFDLKEIRPMKDKYSRFLTFAPFYHRKKIKFMKSMMVNKEYYNEFIDEISKVTKSDGFKSKHDDILDTHSMLQYLDLYAPSYGVTEDMPTLVISSNNFFWKQPDEQDDKFSRDDYYLD